MKAVLLLITLSLLGCKEAPTLDVALNPEDAEYEAYCESHELPVDLPVSKYSRTLHGRSIDGNLVTLTRESAGYRVDEGEVSKEYDHELSQARSNILNDPEVTNAPILALVASHQTGYSKIIEAISAAAKAGFPHVALITKRSEDDYNLIFRCHWIDFPLADGATPPDDAYTFAARIAQNKIISFYDGREMSKDALEGQLAAARAQGSTVVCQLFVAPELSYQDMIDMMSVLRSTGNVDLIFLAHEQ